MTQGPALRVDHVSKKYCKSLKRSMLYGIRDIGRNMVSRRSQSELLRKDEFWAVNDVSFQVEPGETLGLIGPNGSGKTTLLKMLNGIFWPDKGKITVNGRTGALIEVGAGFHPMLSGRDNIYLNAAILGMSKVETQNKFDSIVEFADIGDFLDTPVKHYSSGMFVRLGFAVAVHGDPDILLIDEVLAVGDISFRKKCFKRLKELKEQNTTWVMVSHDLVTIKHHADQVMFMNEGEMQYAGAPEEAISEYLYSISTRKIALEKNSTHSYPCRDLSDLESPIEVEKIKLLDNSLCERNVFATGEPLTIKIDFNAKKKIEKPTFGLAFYNGDGDACTGSNTRLDGYEIKTVNGRGSVFFRIHSLPLYAGVYRLELAIRDKNLGPIADIADAATLKVRGGDFGSGMFYMPHSWGFEYD